MDAPRYLTAEAFLAERMRRLYRAPAASVLDLVARSGVQPAEWYYHLHPRGGGWPRPRGLAERPLAYARVNAGRWIVDCPAPYCQAAQEAAWLDHRFFCVECGNQHAAGRWLPVVWPDAETVAAIERQLDRRPSPLVRHWHPGETISDLAAQDRGAGG